MTEAVPSRPQIEAALQRALDWPGLARSPQLSKFLNYIVIAKLEGRESGIKAYSIAVDVFGRPSSFDPQSDPIVRVQARRLRAALDDYYEGEGSGEAVRFYLPVGRYVPEFGLMDENPLAQTDRESGEVGAASALRAQASRLPPTSDLWLIVLMVMVALGIALAVTQVFAPRQASVEVPQPPLVSVAEFTSIGGETMPAVSLAGLAVELVTDLDLFPYIEAEYVPRLGESGGAKAAPYELSGISRRDGDTAQITASLRRSGSDTAVWSMTQTIPTDAVPDSIDRLSQAFSDQLGALEGPLHADGLNWLQAHTIPEANESEYLCWLLFSLYRDDGVAEDGVGARRCIASLVARQPDSAAALAMSGGLLMDTIRRSQPPGAIDPEPVAEAERQLREALRRAPTSSPVWTEWALYLQSVGRAGEAEAAFVSALQLNPANLDALAGYGRLLSLRGASLKGEGLANAALERSVSPPFWYHEAPAVNALRNASNGLALAEANELSAGDAELGSVIATAAAHRMGAADALNRSIAQLLEVTRFRRFGILPVLRQRLGDADLRTKIGQELAAAGIDQAALNGPY